MKQGDNSLLKSTSPWDNVGVSLRYVFSSQKYKSNLCVETNKSSKPEKQKSLAPRDYKTYNYMKSSANQHARISENTSIESSEGISDFSEGRQEPDNPLHNIICRAEVRRQKREQMRTTKAMNQLILEKKKIIQEKEAARKEKLAKKQKIIEVKEAMRTKEEQSKLRQQRQCQLNKQLEAANRHYEKSLYKKYFSIFRSLIAIKRYQLIQAERHFEENLLRKYLCKWIQSFSEDKQKKNRVADDFNELCVTRNYLYKWKQILLSSQLSRELAQNHYKRHLLSATFHTWRTQHEERVIVRKEQNNQAVKHHNRNLLRRYFESWRNFTSCRRIEYHLFGSDLRSIVRSILPDFSSPMTSDEEDSNECQVASVSY